MSIYTLLCKDDAIKLEVSKVMLERKNSPSEIYLIVSAIGLIAMLQSTTSSIDATNSLNLIKPQAATYLWQIFGFFTLLTLAWNILKRTRFCWVTKAMGTLLIMMLLVSMTLAQNDMVKKMLPSDEVDPNYMGTLLQVAYLIITTYSFYDFKLTLFVGTPALTLALYYTQTAV
jgi:hypothetical protein